jgi:hypothetical protein
MCNAVIFSLISSLIWVRGQNKNHMNNTIFLAHLELLGSSNPQIPASAFQEATKPLCNF